MKKNEVKVGSMYTAKVSDKLVSVRIDSIHSGGGWNATNTRTGKRIRIKSAQRLRVEAKKTAKVENATGDEKIVAKGTPVTGKVVDTTAKTKKASGKRKPKRISALAAAAKVLAHAERPMGAKDLIGAMAEQRLWSSPAGKTPHATLYAAMLREITAKGDTARFKKVDRGMFAFNAMSKK